jgi:hypothetical protein
VYWGAFSMSLVQREIAAWQALSHFNPPYEYYVPPRAAPGTPEEKQRAEEMKRLRDTVDSHRVAFERADADFRFYDRFSSMVTGISILAEVFGLGLLVVGFRWWYTRVQNPQDRILAKQAREADKTIAEQNAPPNGGPTTPVASSGATEGPPSVS